MRSAKQINFFKRLFTAIIFALLFWSLFIFYPIYFNWLILSILLEILLFEWKNFFNYKTIEFWLLAFFYLLIPFSLIILLNSTGYRKLLALSFILVFAFDTGAYISGNLFGKNKIAPSISPGKTWQGLFGGYLLCFFSMLLILSFLGNYNPHFVFIFSLIISALAFFGDLFESYLKRKAKIKDSGSFLPGHGGFLDRFDSIIPVVIFIYIFKNLLIKYI